ncbi:MAG: nucleotidyltransferase domain-containing protein [Planctomycetes bacterium]|nr:nucleotidyltransferase domain-containing protein [Planctomycetota bacterium]
MQADTVVAQIRDYLKGRREIVCAYLFGSVARGEADAASDLDVAILLDGAEAKDHSLAVMVEIEQALKQRLGDVSVDVVVLNDASLRFAHEVIATGKLAFARDDEERVDYEVKTELAYFDHSAMFRMFDRAIEAWALGKEVQLD